MITTDIHKGNWGIKIFSKGKWYLVSSILTKGIGIVLLPVYTHYLEPEAFGILSTLNSVAGILPMFVSLALDSAFSRLYHDYKTSLEQVSILLSTLFWFILIYGSLLVLICIITSELWFEDLLMIPSYPYIYLSFIPVLLNQLSLLGKGILNVTLETKKTAIVDVISSIINGSLSVMLMSIWQLGIIGRLTGIAIASIYMIAFYVWYLSKNQYLRLTFSKKMFIQSIKYSAPLIPYVASVWIGTLSDRLILSIHGGFEKVGIYSLAFQFAIIIYLLGDGFTRVTNVLIMSGIIADKEKTIVNISNYSLILWVIMLTGVFGIYLFAKDLVWLLVPKYYEGAYLLIPIISLTYIFGIQSRFFTDILLTYKRSSLITIGIIFSSIVNLILNLILIPLFGGLGAALATVLSGFTAFLFYYYKSQKLLKVDFLYIKMIINFIIILTLILIVNASAIIDSVSLMNLLVKLFIFTCLCIFMYFINKKSIIEIS